VTLRANGQPLDLFAGLYVRDFTTARGWYTRLLGSAPSFEPHDTEAVWELADHRWLFIDENAARAGHAVHTILVGDLDALVDEIAARGIEPSRREVYGNGARKVLYQDPDGNEIGFGDTPC